VSESECVFVCVRERERERERENMFLYTYRMIHELWTVGDDFLDLVIEKIHINMCLIVNSYSIMTARNLE